MPVIRIDAATLTKEQKEKLSKEITKIASEVMNIPQQAFYFFINEYPLDNIGVGEQLLSDK